MPTKTLKFIDKEKLFINKNNNQISITIPKKKLGSKGLPDKIKVTGFWEK